VRGIIMRRREGVGEGVLLWAAAREGVLRGRRAQYAVICVRARDGLLRAAIEGVVEALRIGLIEGVGR
jgi:hypothetical protein